MKKETHPKWPEPPQNAKERLRHVLDIYEGEPDGMKVIAATSNVYASYGQENYRTGLTLGDLRALAELLEESDESHSDQHDWQPGENGIGLNCSKCGLPHSRWAGGDCPGNSDVIAKAVYW